MALLFALVVCGLCRTRQTANTRQSDRVADVVLYSLPIPSIVDISNSAVRAASNDHHRMVRAYLKEYNLGDKFHLLNRLTRSLEKAAGAGYIETVKALIDGNVRIRMCQTKGNIPTEDDGGPLLESALHKAAEMGQVDILALLLDRTEAPTLLDRVNRSGETALYAAVRQREIKTASLLVRNGANPDLFPGSIGVPAICSAADKGDLELIMLLGDAGANVNAWRHTDGASALAIASLRGDLEVVSYLLHKGANMNMSTKSSGSPPLLLAACSGHVGVISELLHYGAPINNSKNNSGASPLFIAAQIGHFHAVQRLVENGADVNQKRASDGTTPLHIAAQKGFLEIVTFLCDSGARMTRDALSAAIIQGHYDITRYLVEEGVVAQASDLIVAAMKSHHTIVSLLIDAGVPVASPKSTPAQKTALYYIIKKKASPECVRALLEKGARLDIRTPRTSKTLPYLASKKRNLAVLKLLLEFAKKGNVKLDIDVPDWKGRTPLWYGARYGQVKIIKLLLRRGARISAADNKARSCIDIASQKGKNDITSLLVDRAFNSNNLYS